MDRKFKVFIFVFLIFAVESFSQEIVSPNGKIKVEIKHAENELAGDINYRILYKVEDNYTEVLPYSLLGLNRKDALFNNNLKVVKVSDVEKINDNYILIHGKKSGCVNVANERMISCLNSDGLPLDIVFRVYDNGVAFRYSFPNQSDIEVNIINEETTYSFPENTERWVQPYSNVYEDFFPYSIDGNDTRTRGVKFQWGYPALFKVNDNPLWILVSEANITRYNCGSLLSNKDDHNKYKVIYPEQRDNFKQTGAIAPLPWQSPWRTLIIGELADVVESTLITDLSEPNKLKDVSWIKPGPVSWIYWANNHGSKDYKKVVEYIDLAVEMGWPYVLIDWEWDVMENGGDIKAAVAYANKKGIKPLMWYNSGTSWLDPTPVDRLITKEKRENEFTWLNEIGVYGIKVDFFAGDQQDMMKYYIEILEDAAKSKLLVNFHGAVIPRGWSRTYPNLMSIEAVYGAEWYNNRPTLTDCAAGHNCILPFTRNVIGPMDYTPVTFSNSQHPHITSYAHELALSVLFESGLQHFADSPEAYKALPEKPKEFLKNVPVSWDDTKLLDGYPGEKVIMARKKGEKWFVGGINGKDEAQSLEMNFGFLDNGNYQMEIIKDGKTDENFDIEVIEISKINNIKINCLPRGGFVGTITPKS